MKKGFALELVPGEMGEKYVFDATKLADPAAAAAELTAEELKDESLVKFLLEEGTDEELNVLTWKCLGYRFIDGQWDNSAVFPVYAKENPTPPDFIGVTRTYTQQVDEPTLIAVKALHKIVPSKYIPALKIRMRPLGWKGFKMETFGPNQRRRGMVLQWLLYYREELFGIPLEELIKRKEQRQKEFAAQEAEKAAKREERKAEQEAEKAAKLKEEAEAAAAPPKPVYVFDPTALEDLEAAKGGPKPEELTDEALLRNVLLETTDEEINVLVWKCLGYRLVGSQWDATEVFPKWAEKYPTPPDLLGVTRAYSKEIDFPTLKAVQALQRSVPMEYKTLLKTNLKPLGWKGYTMDNLTPNMTRRAQVTQWLMYYREALMGVPLEELQRLKAEKAAQEEAEQAKPPTGGTGQMVL